MFKSIQQILKRLYTAVKTISEQVRTSQYTCWNVEYAFNLRMFMVNTYRFVRMLYR